ncbi:NAD(P)H-dependent oxidoreductase [Candidatus Uhrbacteria bacterium CG22_combo_CG10-13_8_21_14_all_47_17]|uniref:NAD(P)H-dependent oxidoreductase n=1 Tax=Candidatus Uhrbacteria bacterium CG22_combo_CG10-13_8_21_14_all_47_17 TaxID=1975041 RepID=A0A2H0BSB6_9BACT|nr:MAG: NAD(P)H-dependent oxidoreductase [Candidatus Uhrbacteria bacterium CG22_combo_CG10-13_8_21_14_all_47_17]
MKNTITEALNWRYATKEFDTQKKVSDDDLKTILESARLAPSSFGIEPWKFLVVTNPELREKIRKVSYDQSKVTDASHLIILTRRTDASALVDEFVQRASTIEGASLEDLNSLKQNISGAIGRFSPEQYTLWSAKQTYIALGMMVETAALLKIDACPMEGFDATAVNEILGLSEKNLATVSMLPVGFRGEDLGATRKKVRRSFEDVVEFIG